MTFDDPDTFATNVNARVFFDAEREDIDGKEMLWILRFVLLRGWKIEVPEADLVKHECGIL